MESATTRIMKSKEESKNIRPHVKQRDFENFESSGQPGTYSYSSYGYNLLGAAVEGASGMSFGDYMTKNIWFAARN